MGKIISLNKNNSLLVPNNPVIGYIPGDGTGPDIWKAARKVIDHAVAIAYNNNRKIDFKKLPAGEQGFHETGEWLPETTLKLIQKYKIAIKGPLTTPVGHGMKSLNITIRQYLDLFACIRPAKYIKGVPSPCKHPELIDMVIFRENTEDIYLGIEWEAGTKDAKQVLSFINSKIPHRLEDNTTGIGIKTISEKNTKRIVRKAILFAIDNNRKNITIMHKGNIMKYTEGAFLKWGYELAQSEFKNTIITEQDLFEKYNGKIPENKIVLKNRIADNMFQQVLLRPDEYDIIIAPNLNGDYISDTLAAMVGGLGLAPGANIGDKCAVFEATHGSAPKYANLDKVNPGSLILSGAMMLDHMGWDKPADIIRTALQKIILNKQVTYDLARQISGAKELKCSEFADVICDCISSI